MVSASRPRISYINLQIRFFLLLHGYRFVSNLLTLQENYVLDLKGLIICSLERTHLLIGNSGAQTKYNAFETLKQSIIDVKIKNALTR